MQPLGAWLLLKPLRLRCSSVHLGCVYMSRIVKAVQIGLHMAEGLVQLKRCAAMSVSI